MRANDEGQINGAVKTRGYGSYTTHYKKKKEIKKKTKKRR